MKPHKLTTGDWAALPKDDADKYEAECFAALTDSGRDFRKPGHSPTIQNVVENSLPQYMDHLVLPIRKMCPWLLAGQWAEILQENDSFGNPELAAIPGSDLQLSPTTARYARHIAQLFWLFGPMDGLRVAEIGGGYGGLCSLFTKVFRPASYTIYDIDGALALQKRYLSELHCGGHVEYKSTVEPCEYDLVISVAALCELHRPVVDKFGEAILSQSQRGYLAWSRPAEGLETPPELLTWLSGYGKAATCGNTDHLFRSICTAHDTSIFYWGNAQ